MAAARAVLDVPPDAAEIQRAAAAFGLVIEGGHEPQLLEVWADHWPAVRLFGAMQTQWRRDMSGPTGLDYSALPVVERRLGIRGRRAQLAFDHLRLMEAEALRLMRERT
jgi:hypothetical protein